MDRVLKNIFRGGIATEKIARDAEFEALGTRVQRHVQRRFRGSLAIRAVDAGSCNGCELEIHALNNAFYAVERFGIHFVASPRHADVLLVTGPMGRHMQAALRSAYAATPEPKWVVAMGVCSMNGGVFGESYACGGRVADVVPVDLEIPGCPPTPATLLKGLLALLQNPDKQEA